MHAGGYLLAYDVERLADNDAFGWFDEVERNWRPGEWDRVTWRMEEMERVLRALLTELGATPQVVMGRWIHAQTSGWTAVVPRAMLPARLSASRFHTAAEVAGDTVREELRRKLDDCRGNKRAIISELKEAARRGRPAGPFLEDLRRDLPHLLRDHSALTRHTS